MADNCRNCGECCRHVAIQIDTPTERSDYEDIYWYLLHEKVHVFVTENEEEDEEEEENWYVEFITPCKALTKENFCGNYENRPKICSEYSPGNCVSSDGESEEIARFDSAEEFLSYMDKKGIKLR